MAQPSIDTAFVKQYTAEVTLGYQRTGTKLRGGVFTRSGLVGADARFPRFMGQDDTVQKARHGDITPSNPPHDYIDIPVEDRYHGVYVDKLDLLKTNIDERRLVTNQGASAMGRQTDKFIVAALTSVGSSRNVTGSGDLADTAGITKAKILKALEMLNDTDVPDDGQRYGVLSAAGWTNLMNIPEFVDGDYIGQSGTMPYGGGSTQARTWLGVHWTMFSGLTKNGSVRDNYIWHKPAVGLLVQQEPYADITWQGPKQAWFIAHGMSQGAGVLNDAGIVRIKSTEA